MNEKLQGSLINTIIKGRLECYIKKSLIYNPYKKSELYDWEFKLTIDDYLFTDSYRGTNPYSGVEYVFQRDEQFPIWSCDYVGYVDRDINVSSKKIYGFLKLARGYHLNKCNKNLFVNFEYSKDILKYITIFQGDSNSILQIERIYYNNQQVLQQISAGKINMKVK